MIKYIGIISLLIAISIQFSCQKDTSPVIGTPEWLKEYIEKIQGNPEYYGTKIYRYEWKEKIVYHVMIPISSCAYCEVYDQSGTKIEFKDDTTFQDFLSNKKNEVIVWEAKDYN